MSSMMNKIADKLTGHHTATGTAANTSSTTAGSSTSNTGLNSSARNDAALAAGAPAGNQLGGVGPNYSGTNYTASNTGALKEGAQVRDTGLGALNKNTHSTGLNKNTQSSGSNLGRDAALGSGLGRDTTSGSNLGRDAALGSGLQSSNMGSSAASSSLNTTNTGSAMAGDSAMTRSEEHLLVGKERVNVGKAGLHKYVTTEKVSTAVPIIRERAVVEREPITEANRHLAMSGPDFKEAHYEVNLMEERAVAEKEEVPIERVRLRKEVEQTQQYVEADLRKEHIEVIDGTKQLGSSGLTGASSNLAGSNMTGSNTGFNKNSDYAATGAQRPTMGQELRQDARNMENSARRNL